MAAHLIDHRGGVVLLVLRGQTLALVEDELRLFGSFFALARLGNRRDELGPAPGLDDFLGRLAVLVQFPVSFGIFVG